VKKEIEILRYCSCIRMYRGVVLTGGAECEFVG